MPPRWWGGSTGLITRHHFCSPAATASQRCGRGRRLKSPKRARRPPCGDSTTSPGLTSGALLSCCSSLFFPLTVRRTALNDLSPVSFWYPKLYHQEPWLTGFSLVICSMLHGFRAFPCPLICCYDIILQLFFCWKHYRCVAYLLC